MFYMYKLQIISYVEGENVIVDVKTVIDGKVWLNFIFGDFLVIFYDIFQVMVYINDIFIKCFGDCFWDWLRSVTFIIFLVLFDIGGNFFIYIYYIKVFGRK